MSAACATRRHVLARAVPPAASRCTEPEPESPPMLLTRWPLPALLSWAAAWGLFVALQAAGLPPLIALIAAALVGAGLALLHEARWRRLIVAAGFPLSLLIADRSLGLPAWAWLLPLALLIVVYPRRSWGDAPLFPTPRAALQGLAALAPLAPGARVLDA
eukprot:Opistho-2@74266